jgi:hypothetical protein
MQTNLILIRHETGLNVFKCCVLKLSKGIIVDCFNLYNVNIKYVNKTYTASVVAKGEQVFKCNQGNVEVSLAVKETILAMA